MGNCVGEYRDDIKEFRKVTRQFYEGISPDMILYYIKAMIDTIPAFFVELGNRIQKDGMVYDTWILQNRDALVELLRKYCG